MTAITCGLMLKKMDPRQLREDELRYECRMRGVSTASYATQEDLARVLSNHIHRDPVVAQINVLTPEEEAAEATLSMEEMQVMYSEARLLGGYSFEPLRLQSLFIHVLFRIRRVVFRARDETRERLVGMLKKMKMWRDTFCLYCPTASFPVVIVPGEEDPGDATHEMQLPETEDHSRARESRRGEHGGPSRMRRGESREGEMVEAISRMRLRDTDNPSRNEESGRSSERGGPSCSRREDFKGGGETR